MTHPYGSSYLETRILSATPLELVAILYENALEAVRDARHYLAAGDIRQRGRAVGRAQEIVAELSSSLDHNAGGELSARLAALYDFIQQNLIDANFRQDEEGLKTAESLLATLQEAWTAILAKSTVDSVAYLRTA